MLSDQIAPLKIHLEQRSSYKRPALCLLQFQAAAALSPLAEGSGAFKAFAKKREPGTSPPRLLISDV